MSRIPQLRAAPPLQHPPGPSPPASPVADALSGEDLRYTGANPMALRGPFSGRIYRVTAQSRHIIADSRDIAALLRSEFFQR